VIKAVIDGELNSNSSRDTSSPQKGGSKKGSLDGDQTFEVTRGLEPMISSVIVSNRTLLEVVNVIVFSEVVVTTGLVSNA